MKLRVDDLTWREIDGDLVVLDLRSSTYLTANASATVLMKQLTEDRTDVELVQALTDAFGISPTQAEQGVRTFISELERNGLLDRPEAGLRDRPATTEAAMQDDRSGGG
jgi:Coenzyme PQQ synthesis protein D (PqqD)